MEFLAHEYYMYKGVEHGRVGNLEMFFIIDEEGPMFPSDRGLKMFESYLFGYLIGLGYKGVYCE